MAYLRHGNDLFTVSLLYLNLASLATCVGGRNSTGFPVLIDLYRNTDAEADPDMAGMTDLEPVADLVISYTGISL
jgi:hypothetical protein